MVKEFLKYGHFSKEISRAHLVLIPKWENPKKNDDTHVILYNVSYNSISKQLANRLEVVLSK